MKFCKNCGALLTSKKCTRCGNFYPESIELKFKETINKSYENNQTIEQIKKSLFPQESEFKEIKENSLIEDCFYLQDYLPRTKYIQNEFSSNILEVKNKNPSSIEKMAELINNNINLSCGSFTLVNIPSSDPSNNENGMSLIIKKLIKNNIIDGRECLVRIEKRVPRHQSRDNNLPIEEQIEKEKKTLGVKKEELIKDKNILLFDDVLTKGVSFNAAKRLLYEKGAKTVIGVILGKTKNG